VKFKQNQGLEGVKRWSRQLAEHIGEASEEDWVKGKRNKWPKGQEGRVDLRGSLTCYG
jgi:hypothetical protein